LYQQYFNFHNAPFSIAPDPHFIFMSEQHQEGLALLLYGIREEGGFVALTGEVGTGKTTLCHCLLEQLPENVDIALVLNPKLNTLELLATICDELQIEYSEEKQSIKHLIDRINKHLLAAHADNRKTILMIDEAQNLSLDVLEQIRLLTNLETSKSKLLQIILVGQPELKQLLEKPELRQLNQRIIARYHLTPLSYSETLDYISHRLAISGGQTSIFNLAAKKRVYQLTKGIPRLVNVICDRALLGAYAMGQKRVTAKTIVQAANENFNKSRSSVASVLKKVLPGIATLVFLMGSAYLITKHYLPSLSKAPVDLATPVPVKDVIQEKKQPLQQAEKARAASAPNDEAINIIKPATVPQSDARDFISTMILQDSSLDSALSRLISIIDNKIPDDANCERLQALGVECLFDQSSWKKLIAFNRPVIMEFSLSATKKVYGLLVGLNANDAIFQFANDALSFPVGQVLASWDGYYLLLWQPPIKNTLSINPQQTSKSVVWLRKQFSGDGRLISEPEQADFFDDELKMQVLNFQKQHNLSVDGIVGLRTIIQLQNENSLNNYPKLRN
jgi:general secretion pathway protein A